MNRSFLYALMATSFGSSSPRPIKKALASLFTIQTAAVTVGLLISRKIWLTSLPTDLPMLWLASSMMFASFGVFASCLILMQFSASSAHSHSFQRIIQVLPISRITAWMASFMPELTVTFTLSLIAIPLSIALAHTLHLQVWLSLAAILLGTLSACGFALLPLPRKVLHTIKPPSLAIVLWLGIRALEASLTRQWISWTIVYCLLVIQVGIVASYAYGAASDVSYAGKPATLPTKYLSRDWFGLKLIRNKTTRTDVLFTVCLLGLLAQSIHSQLHDDQALILLIKISAVLSGGIAALSRSIYRMHKPPEIRSVSTLHYLLVSQRRSVILMSAVVCLPALVLMIIEQRASPEMLLQGIGSQVVAVSIGLIVGSWLAPQSGDLGSQILSVITTEIVLYGWFTLYDRIFSIALLAGCVILVLSPRLTTLLEQSRLRSYGHTA